MATTLLKRLTSGYTPIAALILSLLLSFALLGDAIENSAHFGRLYSILLLVNGLGMLLLFGLIGNQLFVLINQLRQRRPGARLTRRMVILFVLLSLLPASFVFYYSIQFLHRGIDSWFDVRIESALGDALELGQVSLDLQVNESARLISRAAEQLEAVTDTELPLRLDDLRAEMGAAEAVVLDASGKVLAFSSLDPVDIVPNVPEGMTLMGLPATRPYATLEPITGKGLHIRALSPIPGSRIDGTHVLQALFQIPERAGALADNVQLAYGRYQELAYLRTPLKYSFTVTLSMILLLSLLSAVWAAFFSARRLASPILQLAKGTEAVAAGDYGRQVPATESDEIGQLIQSFNSMSRRIAESRDAARRSRKQVEDQRTYLETVLGHLSSGVLTLGSGGRLHTANFSAGQILQVDIAQWIGRDLRTVLDSHPHIQTLLDLIDQRHQAPAEEWQEEISLAAPSGSKTLLCRGSRLPEESHGSEWLVVFDDITALIRAQRDAAWSEVAQRLAHEIKNPLTPIKLSAERLQLKYSDQLPEEALAPLRRYTDTIIHQVESMREMVDAFSQYARTPPLQPQRVDLKTLVAEVIELYQMQGVSIACSAPEVTLPVEADPNRLRQVMHNLIKNALEASTEAEDAIIQISLRAWPLADGGRIEIQVSDNGSGFDPKVLDRVFEPYVSNKTKGSGLGLAIVKKIVEEHNGNISVGNGVHGGGEVKIILPTLSLMSSLESTH